MSPQNAISIPLSLIEEWMPLLGTDVVGLYIFYLGKSHNGTLDIESLDEEVKR